MHSQFFLLSHVRRERQKNRSVDNRYGPGHSTLAKKYRWVERKHYWKLEMLGNLSRVLILLENIYPTSMRALTPSTKNWDHRNLYFHNGFFILRTLHKTGSLSIEEAKDVLNDRLMYQKEANSPSHATATVRLCQDTVLITISDKGCGGGDAILKMHKISHRWTKTLFVFTVSFPTVQVRINKPGQDLCPHWQHT